MAAEKNLKTILTKLQFHDDAQVMQQIQEQIIQVKTRMGLIRRKLVIMSGKGGVGKSMTTANLALALARQGHKVGILDVDLNGPCIPKMLGMKGQRFTITSDGAIPPTGPLNIKVASMEFFLKEESPIRWKGPMDLSPVWLGMMEMSVIREFLADIVWGELEYLLADLPPGAAADKPPVIIGFLPELDGAVVVTTPSQVSTEVVKKSILYSRDIGIPVLGLIENMSGYLCPECHAESSLFNGTTTDISSQLDVQLLGKIPFDPTIGQSCDQGTPLVRADSIAAQRFDQIAQKIHSMLEAKKVFVQNKKGSAI
jgi:ATP-binding protein involved in chromosome partitioning